MNDLDVLKEFFPSLYKCELLKTIPADHSRAYLLDYSAKLYRIHLAQPPRNLDIVLFRAAKISSPPESDENFAEQMTGRIIVGYFTLGGTLRYRGDASAIDEVLETPHGDYCVGLLSSI